MRLDHGDFLKYFGADYGWKIFESEAGLLGPYYSGWRRCHSTTSAWLKIRPARTSARVRSSVALRSWSCALLSRLGSAELQARVFARACSRRYSPFSCLSGSVCRLLPKHPRLICHIVLKFPAPRLERLACAQPFLIVSQRIYLAAFESRQSRAVHPVCRFKFDVFGRRTINRRLQPLRSSGQAASLAGRHRGRLGSLEHAVRRQVTGTG